MKSAQVDLPVIFKSGEAVRTSSATIPIGDVSRTYDTRCYAMCVHIARLVGYVMTGWAGLPRCPSWRHCRIVTTDLQNLGSHTAGKLNTGIHRSLTKKINSSASCSC